MNYIWKACFTAVLLCSIFELGCGDAFRQIATPILQPAGNPSNSGTIGVVQRSGAIRGFMQQIDVSGDANLGEKPIGTGATVGALDPSGTTMFTANTTSNDVTAISVTTFNEVTISLPSVTGVGAGPTYIGGTKTGTMYVAVSGATEACASGAGYLGVIDSNNLTLVKSICLTDISGQGMLNPNFLVQSPDTLKVYVLDSTANKVAIIDAASGVVDKIVSVGSLPVFATFSLDQQFVYILNRGSDNITVFRVSDQAVVGTFNTSGTGARFMQTDTRLNRLYVANTGSGTISVFDISNTADRTTPTLLGGAPVTVGPSPIALTALADGSRVYVANSGDGTVTELLASNLTKVAPLPIIVNSAPSATTTSITSSNDSTKVYVSSIDPLNTSNGTTVIRTSDDTIVTTIKSPKLDPACVTACPLFQPVFVFTQRR